METLGNCGRSGRDYTGAESVLAGRLASEIDSPDAGPVVFPDDYCAACVAEGKGDQDKCFHKHWGGKDEH